MSKLKNVIWPRVLEDYSTSRFIFLMTLFVFFISCENQQNLTTTYFNPVIPGEIPDPSVIRVGDTYFAIGTSFDFAPTYPVYESKDLINWKHIGSVFSEPPELTSDDFWAPELFYNDSTFFVYYTTKRKGNHIACIGIGSTKDIYKGFTDHGIIVEWGEEAIDAFVFKDEDEKLYITWKAYGLNEERPIEILGSELSTDGLKLVGEPFTLCDPQSGWRPGNDEGQCIVKHGEYYYMLYSDGGCCDNKCDYRIMVSRSKNLKTGWEQIDQLILEGGEVWRCPGHGTLVTTPDGRYFYLYHAYNITDFEYIGRQGMLDELAWDEESGWPYMVNGKNPTVQSITPFPNTIQKRNTIRDDYFASEKELNLREWDLFYTRPSTDLVKGVLTVKTTHEGYNFMGFRPEVGNYTYKTNVNINDNLSGIGIYTNQQKMLSIAAKNRKIVVYKLENSIKEILAEVVIEVNDVFLKYELNNGKIIQFFWSIDDMNWNPIMINNEQVYDASFLAIWGYSPRAGFIIEGNENIAEFAETEVEYSFR